MIFLCALILTSCASTRKQTSRPEVYVTDAKKISLLPADGIRTDFEALQLFTGSIGAKQFSAQMYLSCDAEKIEVILLNDFGLEVGRLLYTDDVLEFDAPYFPKNIKPAYIVADLQNVYADGTLLKENYASVSLAFSEEQLSDGTHIRRICDGDTVIEEIKKTGGTLVIRNNLRGYTYRLVEIPE